MKPCSLAAIAATLAATSPALAQEPLYDPCATEAREFSREYVDAIPNTAYTERRQMQVLQRAATILALHGDEEGCRMLLRHMRTLGAAPEEGFAPEEVRAERQEQLQQTRSIAELPIVRTGAIIGADVRNLRDEDLGDIEDVVIDPQTGEISHALLAREGFLGLGEDLVAVPWERLQATRDRDLFVLNISDEALESAPTVDADAFGEIATETWRNRNAQFYTENLLD